MFVYMCVSFGYEYLDKQEVSHCYDDLLSDNVWVWVKVWVHPNDKHTWGGHD